MIRGVLRTRNHPQAGRTTTWFRAFVAVLALPGWAQAPLPSPDMELEVEVLRGSVSKLAKDSFGNAVNPFNSFNLWEADPGTVVLAKFTPGAKIRESPQITNLPTGERKP